MSNIHEIKKEIRGAEFRKIMHEHVDLICDQYDESGMAGFHVTGWGFDGSFSNGWRIHDESQFGITLLPAVISEIMRRNVSQDAALDVVHEML